MSLLSAIVLMLLMLPDALGLIAGYQIHSLEKNQEKLARENAMLELDEARLLSPERLQQLAGQLQLVDPDPTRVVYLNPPTDGSLALNMHLRQRGL
jgi:hypothetical protein